MRHERIHLEPQQTWWVVYSQDVRRTKTSKNVGTGARYALQTFMGSSKMVEHEFKDSLIRAFERRQEALDFLNEMNIVDSVQNS